MKTKILFRLLLGAALALPFVGQGGKNSGYSIKNRMERDLIGQTARQKTELFTLQQRAGNLGDSVGFDKSAEEFNKASLTLFGDRPAKPTSSLGDRNKPSNPYLDAGDTLAPTALPQPNPLPGTFPYTVKSGDTLRTIAQSHGVAPEKLHQVNRLGTPVRIFVGQTLQIPAVTASATNQPQRIPVQRAPEVTEQAVVERVDANPSSVADAPPVSRGTGTLHTIQRGETLFSISRRYGVPVATLTSANQLSDPSKIFAGQKLTIPGATKTAASSPAPRQSTDRPAVENPAWVETVLAGQAPSSPPAPPEKSGPLTPPATPRSYLVKNGDTLYSIAKAHGMTHQHLAAINGLEDGNFIRVGQSLQLQGEPVALAAQSEAPKKPTPPPSEPPPPAPAEEPSPPAVVEESEPAEVAAQSTETNPPVEQQQEKEETTSAEESSVDRLLIRYPILEGDTLESVARTFNTTAQDIAALNQLAPSAKLEEGQEIWVPGENLLD
ncbi:MAG: LysM peptidoglycan-binding domain-containing protein [Verrucomicrobiota bacterium]